ncbi:helix-turn-helix domain-containing protein [Hydrogenispora ethanolica]|uniref:helix-turn-helix domain-containing protein n=1 Tax=Hydrogenispora ethanolica TaxID=1082276 RepID=UPI001404EA0E|nr:helix-turn-helix transcriptional regulator [Hydrogenispora ethanolica]
MTSEERLKAFASYIKALRNDRKLTIHQVEAYSGVSNSYLSLLENAKRGIPSPEILRKLAPVYKVPYEELMIKAGYAHKGFFEIDEDGLAHLNLGEFLPPDVLELARNLRGLPLNTLELAQKINQLTPDQQKIIEAMVEQLLDKENERK